MKAIQIELFGRPSDVLQVVDVPDVSAPAAGEVVIAVEASPIITASIWGRATTCRKRYIDEKLGDGFD